MTLKKHPEVPAILVIAVMCAFGSRTQERPQFRLSHIEERVAERQALAEGRAQCAVERLESKIEQALDRLQARVERKRLRVRGL